MRALAAGGVRESFSSARTPALLRQDLGDLRLLVTAPQLGSIDGLGGCACRTFSPPRYVRVLVDVIAATPRGPVLRPRFQHASASVLRRMRRFGGSGAFLDLLGQIRAVAPEAGIRSNFIVFPGGPRRTWRNWRGSSSPPTSTPSASRFTPADGTDSGFDDKCDPQIAFEKAQDLADLAQALMADRAERGWENSPGSSSGASSDGVAEVGRTPGSEDADTLVPIDPVAQGRPLQVGDLVNAVHRDRRARPGRAATAMTRTDAIPPTP